MSKASENLTPIFIGIIIFAGIALGVWAVWKNDPSGASGNRLPSEFNYSLEKYQKIDPNLIKYRPAAEFPLKMKEPRAIAVGLEDMIYIVGDRSLAIYSPAGELTKTIDLDDQPRCITIGGADHVVPGRIYIGMKNRIEAFDSPDAKPTLWKPLGEKASLTSLAAAEQDVFAADAENRIVWHYDTDGKLQGRIGERDESRNIHGFVIPSPHFELAIAPDGLLRVVNPGMHRIEAYTFDGHLEVSWGTRGLDVPNFCGCCNPASLAILPNGNFVTGEKGIARVKIYDAEGKFNCVVAGPDILSPNFSAITETREDLRLKPVDLAVDSASHIIVLDPNEKIIRIFVEKK